MFWNKNHVRNPIVVVGLGNPGERYARTRHNAGFDVLDILAQRWGWKIKRSGRRCLCAEGKLEGACAVLAKPQTFMNDSGAAAAALVQWYKIDPASLLVVYDDVDLPIGKIRVRASGGPGTHNGMRSMLQHLGHGDFPRVRVGISAPPQGWDIKDWVLSKRRGEENEPALEAMGRAADAVEMFIKTRDIEQVMRTYNVKS